MMFEKGATDTQVFVVVVVMINMDGFVLLMDGFLCNTSVNTTTSASTLTSSLSLMMEASYKMLEQTKLLHCLKS
jgi:hypothetical protein